MAGHGAGGHPRRGARQSASCAGSGHVGRSRAPDAMPPAVRSAGCRGAAHTAPHRWSRPTAVCPCRQDTRVAAVRQSARASSPRLDVSGHTATAMDRRVCAGAVADELEPMPGSAPCRVDRGRASRYGRARGSRCWAPASTPSPSSATNGRRPAPDSRFHVLRHACVDKILFAWQHRSLSGSEVLHLELELKPRKRWDTTDKPWEFNFCVGGVCTG